MVFYQINKKQYFLWDDHVIIKRLSCRLWSCVLLWSLEASTKAWAPARPSPRLICPESSPCRSLTLLQVSHTRKTQQALNDDHFKYSVCQDSEKTVMNKFVCILCLTLWLFCPLVKSRNLLAVDKFGLGDELRPTGLGGKYPEWDTQTNDMAMWRLEPRVNQATPPTPEPSPHFSQNDSTNNSTQKALLIDLHTHR